MFICEIHEIQHYRDNYNYDATREYQRDRLQAETLDELYVKMAEFKINTDNGDPKTDYEYERAEFGTIYEIVSEHYVDDDRILNTTVYIAHQAKLAREAEEAVQLREKLAAQARINQEASERATLAKLQVKYGEKP